MAIVIATFISIVLSAGSLIWGFAQLGFDPFTRWLLFFGVAWLFAQSQRWWWFHGVTLILTVVFGAFGMLLGIAPGWMLAAGIFALITWDLSEFRRHTRFELRKDKLHEAQRRHLARVTLLAFAGLFLSSISMWLRRDFTMEWGLLLLLVLVLGLPQLIHRKAENT